MAALVSKLSCCPDHCLAMVSNDSTVTNPKDPPPRTHARSPACPSLDPSRGFGAALPLRGDALRRDRRRGGLSQRDEVGAAVGADLPASWRWQTGQWGTGKTTRGAIGCYERGRHRYERSDRTLRTGLLHGIATNGTRSHMTCRGGFLEEDRCPADPLTWGRRARRSRRFNGRHPTTPYTPWSVHLLVGRSILSLQVNDLI